MGCSFYKVRGHDCRKGEMAGEGRRGRGEEGKGGGVGGRRGRGEEGKGGGEWSAGGVW